VNYPETYRYTKEHEWVGLADGVATIGITFHAQEELGDIVYVDFKYGRETLKPGQHVDQGKTIGSVESVKAVSDIYCPVSGHVVDLNHTLADAPEKLNEDPHGEAWLVKIRLSNPGELTNLLSAAEYQTYIGAEK